jgi:hypothetical protein
MFLLWFVGRWAGLLGALVSAGFWFWEDVLSRHAYPDQAAADWNIAMRLIFLVLFVQAVAALKAALERERAAAQERLERDVRIAQEVQTRLFPQKAPEVRGIECFGVCRPAAPCRATTTTSWRSTRDTSGSRSATSPARASPPRSSWRACRAR